MHVNVMKRANHCPNDKDSVLLIQLHEPEIQDGQEYREPGEEAEGRPTFLQEGWGELGIFKATAKTSRQSMSVEGGATCRPLLPAPSGKIQTHPLYHRLAISTLHTPK